MLSRCYDRPVDVQIEGLTEDQVRAVIREQARRAAASRKRVDVVCALPGCGRVVESATTRRRYCTPAHRAKAARGRAVDGLTDLGRPSSP